MRFQVPQFVYIEDKVIGPLTIRQFSYYLMAVMFLGLLYATVSLGVVITLGLPIIGITALFAHGKLYGQSFTQILVAAFGFFTGERLYLWRRVPENKLLKITGAEYGDYNSEMQSIMSLSQDLNTDGNVVGTDAKDPLIDEDSDEALEEEVDKINAEVEDLPSPKAFSSAKPAKSADRATEDKTAGKAAGQADDSDSDEDERR